MVEMFFSYCPQQKTLLPTLKSDLQYRDKWGGVKGKGGKVGPGGLRFYAAVSPPAHGCMARLARTDDDIDVMAKGQGEKTICRRNQSKVYCRLQATIFNLGEFMSIR
jgi:hypothetical protein